MFCCCGDDVCLTHSRSTSPLLCFSHSLTFFPEYIYTHFFTQNITNLPRGELLSICQSRSWGKVLIKGYKIWLQRYSYLCKILKLSHMQNQFAIPTLMAMLSYMWVSHRSDCHITTNFCVQLYQIGFQVNTFYIYI